MYLSAVAHKSMYAENIEALERALKVVALGVSHST